MVKVIITACLFGLSIGLKANCSIPDTQILTAKYAKAVGVGSTIEQAIRNARDTIQLYRGANIRTQSKLNEFSGQDQYGSKASHEVYVESYHRYTSLRLVDKGACHQSFWAVLESDDRTLKARIADVEFRHANKDVANHWLSQHPWFEEKTAPLFEVHQSDWFLSDELHSYHVSFEDFAALATGKGDRNFGVSHHKGMYQINIKPIQKHGYVSLINLWGDGQGICVISNQKIESNSKQWMIPSAPNTHQNIEMFVSMRTQQPHEICKSFQQLSRAQVGHLISQALAAHDIQTRFTTVNF
jgi:hypothetical protein